MKNAMVLSIGGLIVFLYSLFDGGEKEAREVKPDPIQEVRIEHMEGTRKELYSDIKTEQELINYQLDTIMAHIKSNR